VFVWRESSDARQRIDEVLYRRKLVAAVIELRQRVIRLVRTGVEKMLDRRD
jgi:hypothetical protein